MQKTFTEQDEILCEPYQLHLLHGITYGTPRRRTLDENRILLARGRRKNRTVMPQRNRDPALVFPQLYK